jgi:hypothetical protein
MDKVKAMWANYIRNSSQPERVAEVIYKAATDPSDRIRHLAGADAKRVAPLRRLLGAGTMMKMVKRMFKL